MKLTLAFGALVATVAAVAAPDFPRVEKRQSAFNTASALLAIQSALPSSLLQIANTNSGAASSAIAAQFATATPSWFTGLPSDVQTYLRPTGALGALSSAATSANGTAAGIVPPRPSVGNSMPYGTNGTSGAGVAGYGTGGSAGAGGATRTSGSGSATSGSGTSSTGGSGSGGAGASSARASSAGGAGASSTGGQPAQTAAWGMGAAGVVAAIGMIAL